jgi:hypothetical protein
MLACISPFFRLIDPLSFEARSIGTTKEKSQEENNLRKEKNEKEIKENNKNIGMTSVILTPPSLRQMSASSAHRPKKRERSRKAKNKKLVELQTEKKMWTCNRRLFSTDVMQVLDSQ